MFVCLCLARYIQHTFAANMVNSRPLTASADAYIMLTVVTCIVAFAATGLSTVSKPVTVLVCVPLIVNQLKFIKGVAMLITIAPNR